MQNQPARLYLFNPPLVQAMATVNRSNPTMNRHPATCKAFWGFFEVKLTQP
jgi:hypothetical protein